MVSDWTSESSIDPICPNDRFGRKRSNATVRRNTAYGYKQKCVVTAWILPLSGVQPTFEPWTTTRPIAVGIVAGGFAGRPRSAADRGATRWPAGSLDQRPPYGEPVAVPRRLAAAFGDDDGRGDPAPGTATGAPGRAFRRWMPPRPPATRQRQREAAVVAAPQTHPGTCGGRRNVSQARNWKIRVASVSSDARMVVVLTLPARRTS